MDRYASAVWHGTLKEGKGTISTQSGTLKDTQYSFAARFAEGVGTNPEELIAAAHAGCFTMALSAQLTEAGFKPETLETKAVLTLDLHGEAPTITKIHLTNTAKIPGIDKAKFDELAGKAKAGCPVSRVLKAAEITLDATLVSHGLVRMVVAVMVMAMRSDLFWLRRRAAAMYRLAARGLDLDRRMGNAELSAKR